MGTGFPETKGIRPREACVVGFCHFIAITPKVLVFSFYHCIESSILFHYICVPQNLIISSIDCMMSLALKKKRNMKWACQNNREKKD